MRCDRGFYIVWAIHRIMTIAIIVCGSPGSGKTTTLYRLLLDAAGAGDPGLFRETDLFKQCVAAGVPFFFKQRLRPVCSKLSPVYSGDQGMSRQTTGAVPMG